MALDAAQVETLQNSTPTDWSKFDQQLASRSNYDANRYAGDDKLHVRFFNRPELNMAESEKAGRPIYKDTTFVECMIPGDKQNIVVEPIWADEAWTKRFPKQWEQFQAGVKDQVVGTPLKLAPFLTESQAAELAYFQVRTVEQLAGMADGNMNFMGARMLREEARKFLAKMQSSESLAERVKELEAKLAEVSAAQGKKAA